MSSTSWLTVAPLSQLPPTVQAKLRDALKTPNDFRGDDMRFKPSALAWFDQRLPDDGVGGPNIRARGRIRITLQDYARQRLNRPANRHYGALTSVPTEKRSFELGITQLRATAPISWTAYVADVDGRPTTLLIV